MADINLTIIGTRRLGASLALALKRYQETKGATHHFNITGYDADHKICKEAQKHGALDKAARRLAPACEHADIVFIDAPLPDLKRYLKKIGPVLKAGCVVLEAARLKQAPIEWAARYLPESAYLVGLTLILNPERLYAVENDPASADADLFTRGGWCIVVSADAPSGAVQLATDLGKLLGLEPHFIDPAEHDGLVAATEGLPILMSLALFKSVYRDTSEASTWLEMRRLTNPAFARATAALIDTPEALHDFLTRNRTSVLHYLDGTIDELIELRRLLRQSDDATLGEVLTQTAKHYREWDYQRFLASWKQETKLEVPSLSRAMFGGLSGMFGRGKDDEDDDA